MRPRLRPNYMHGFCPLNPFVSIIGIQKISHSKDRPGRGLWIQIALPFLVFVAAGSVALTAWLETSFQRGSRERFATLARTNAAFIRGSRLPHSAKTADDLGRILNLKVYFQDRSIPPATDESTASAPVDQAVSLVLVRPKGTQPLFQPLTLFVLAVFWALTLALAGALARGVVRPLRRLAERLPQVEEEIAERRDEIGLLARAYNSERQRRESAERLALLGRMATGLAHEIHNPLSGIRMHLQLLQSETSSESIPIALGETAKIEGLVNQWMFLARPAPPRTSPADVGELLDAVTRSIRPLADHARVRIERDIPPGLRVAADARRLNQALGNVALNAIQAMPGGGTLRVAAHNGGGAVVVIFRDSGGGFSENALAHYAELFYSEKEGGMGIGLNVASEIVKAHEGALRVENSPDGGAVVTIELPALS